jgi:predicted esterase
MRYTFALWISALLQAQPAAQESYEVLLPPAYSPERAWPILYCFDPGARGRVPIDLLRESAGKYGWIVAASNVSRNGPFDVSLKAAEDMWRDTHERFRIDPARVYTAGFSGGARVATVLALMTGQVAGVIACSGGFPGGRIPEKVGFSLFVTGGTEDFNLDEVRDIELQLTARNAKVRLAVFEGPHEWAAAPTMAEALAWMQFQAGLGRETWRDSRLKAISAFEAAGRLAEACAETAALARDLGDAELAARAASCRKSPAFRDALARQAQWRSAEVQYTRDLESRDGALPDQTLASLRKMAARPGDTDERRMARRVLAGSFVHHFESAREARGHQDLRKAQSELEWCTRLRPDDPGAWYADAAVAAERGDRKRVLRSLQLALDHGFRDSGRLNRDPVFAKLRETPEFDRLILECETKAH